MRSVAERLLFNIVHRCYRVALIQFDIVNCILKVRFGPQVSFTTSIGPWAIGKRPLIVFPQITRGVRLESIQNSTWTARCPDDGMYVIRSNICFIQPPTQNITCSFNRFLNQSSLFLRQFDWRALKSRFIVGQPFLVRCNQRSAIPIIVSVYRSPAIAV